MTNVKTYLDMINRHISSLYRNMSPLEKQEEERKEAERERLLKRKSPEGRREVSRIATAWEKTQAAAELKRAEETHQNLINEEKKQEREKEAEAAALAEAAAVAKAEAELKAQKKREKKAAAVAKAVAALKAQKKKRASATGRH